jgi:hypothetical protein
VLTVSSKYVVENQTGVPIEVKQRGAPDALPAAAAAGAAAAGDAPKALAPARHLGVGARSALHWEVRGALSPFNSMLLCRNLELF